MSIAELIMTGTQQASKSTDWVADSLAKIGDNVSKVYREREQNKRAQEMLPMLQQGIQESMTLAGQGQSGAAYSKMLGMLTPEVMNTPQSMTLVKLGLDAVGKSTDDFILTKKANNQGSSIVELLLAKQLGLELPTTPTQPTTPSTNVVPKPKPSGGGNTALADFDTPVDAVNLPANPEEGQGDSGLTAPVGTGSNQQAPSPTQAKVAQGFKTIKQQIDSGTPFSSVMSESTKMIFPKDQVQPFSKRIIAMPKLEKYIPGAEGITELDSPDVLRQKNMNISSRSGMSLSFENVDPLYDYQKANKPFTEKINEAISTLDSDGNLQKAIKALGGFENISIETDAKGYFIPVKEGDAIKKFRIKDATREQVAYMAGVPQAAKNAMMPLYGTEVIDMPSASAVGVTSKINPKVAEAVRQAKMELPGQSNDKILERARAIAAGVK
jgi:hypothetical protein